MITNATHVKAVEMIASNVPQGGSIHLYVSATLATTINIFQAMISVMTLIVTKNVKLVSILLLPV